MQPHHSSPDTERAVLGSCLLNPAAFQKAFDILGDDGFPFSEEKHAFIWEKMVSLSAMHIKIDEITLSDMCRDDQILETVGGASYIAGLTSAVATSANVEFYARQVEKQGTLRVLERTIGKLFTMAQTCSEPERLGEYVRSALLPVFERCETGTSTHQATESVEQALAMIRATAEGENTAFIPTGLAIDNTIYGWRPGVNIVAARPSVGKTALAIQTAVTAAQAGKRALFFSMEMSHEAIGQRLASHLSGVNWTQVHSGFNIPSQIANAEDAVRRVEGLPLWIDDAPRLTSQQIQARCRKHMREHGLDLVFVDYLQLITTASRRGDKRYQEIGETVRELKIMSGEMPVTVVLACQFNREADDISDVFRLLRCLRESGDIEQHADVVLALVAFTHDEAEKLRKRRKDDLPYEKIVVAAAIKNRNGKTGLTRLYYDRETQRFSNMNGHGTPPPGSDADEAEQDDLF